MKWTVIALLLSIILISSITGVHAAKPWDLLITAKFEHERIGIDEKPILVGIILDQKGKPVPGVKVQIRFAEISANTTTNDSGNFRYEFFQSQREGIFVANISAKLNELKGMGKASLRIGNGVSTFDEMYYSKDFENSTQNDPYKSIKDKRYEKFIEDQNKKRIKQIEIEAKLLALADKRNATKQSLEDAINATNPSAGVYSYSKQTNYLAKKDSRLKPVIQSQMEYTREIYEQAKNEMKKVLDTGGSLEDAKKAYFAKLTTTREQVEKIGAENNTASQSKVKSNEEKKINSKKVKGLKYNKYLK